MERSVAGMEARELARKLMLGFAGDTGLDPPRERPRRYLWTDAFAVCNYLGDHRASKSQRPSELAERLIEQVHRTLGRHREDDRREGWISGLPEVEGAAHPTIGGLRIGKRLNERSPHELPDPYLEWEQDGQYYHYLTKWMHALVQAGRILGEERYVDQAVELARAAHGAFVYASPFGGRRMYWKMSIDLSRPLVTSMGQHDPLEGYLTYLEIEDASRALGRGAVLEGQVREMRSILDESYFATDDPLGIGSLLSDTCRAAQLLERGVFEDTTLFEGLMRASAVSLDAFAQGHMLDYPVESRLAFRELGLSIGLHGIDMLRAALEILEWGNGRLAGFIDTIAQYAPLADQIESTWVKKGNRESCTWTDHKDINAVMLATSLEPSGFLVLG
jgi:hypothetical protein